MLPTLLCTLCAVAHSKAARMATYDNIQHVLDIKKYLTQDVADELYTKKETHEEYEENKKFTLNFGNSAYSITYIYKLPDFNATTYSINVTYKKTNENNENDVEYKSVVFNVVNKETKSNNVILENGNEVFENSLNNKNYGYKNDACFLNKNNEIIKMGTLEHYIWLHDIVVDEVRTIAIIVYTSRKKDICDPYCCLSYNGINYNNEYFISSITYSNTGNNNACGDCSTSTANNYKIFNSDDAAITVLDNIYGIDIGKDMKNAQSITVDVEVYDVHFVVQSSMKNLDNDNYYYDVAMIDGTEQDIRLCVSTSSSKLEIYAATVEREDTPTGEHIKEKTRIDASKVVIKYIAVHE